MDAIKGSGTLDNPIRRGEFSCAVRGCPEDGRMTRVTETGYFVAYCRAHEREASALFDRVEES